MKTIEHFVGGKSYSGDSKRTSKVFNPATGDQSSEVNLAIETSHKLAKDKIYSKVISVPCMELFDIQSNGYKNKRSFL